MGVGMSDACVWCTCTTARTWGESLASPSNWLAARVAVAAAGQVPEREGATVDTESTSASEVTARLSLLDTTTTRIPSISSATRSW